MAIESTRSPADQENKAKRNFWIIVTIVTIAGVGALIFGLYWLLVIGSPLGFLFAILLVILFLLFPMRDRIRAGNALQWIGLRGCDKETEEIDSQGNLVKITKEHPPDKTLWDWIAAIVVPAALIAGILQFTLQQHNDRVKSIEQHQQATLETYLDRMSDLLLKEDLRTNSDAQAVAQARTYTALRDLDGGRRGALVRFLWEAKLINGATPIISLNEANLREVILIRADLRGANLSGALLSGADLTHADLKGTNLSGADLDDAKLEEAKYNTKTSLEEDPQRKPLSLGPTQWPQGFDPKAAGAIICNNNC